MQNDFDLSHIDRQIHQDTADVDFARRQANNQRMTADQKYRDGDTNGAMYYEKEADRFERKADELEAQIDQLQTNKKRLEQRVQELLEQRSHVDREHAERIAQIDRELAQARGNGMML
jgi:response regulator RpfG family c-di-GMP phosphodiesterase